MNERRMIRMGLAALVVVVLVGFGISGLQQSAWSQGYMLGLAAGGGEGDALSHYLLVSAGRHGPIAGGFATLFHFGFLLFGLFFVAKMLRMISWRMAGGPEGWARHSRHHKGCHGMSPWHREEEHDDSEAESKPVTSEQSATPDTAPVQDPPAEK